MNTWLRCTHVNILSDLDQVLRRYGKQSVCMTFDLQLWPCFWTFTLYVGSVEWTWLWNISDLDKRRNGVYRNVCICDLPRGDLWHSATGLRNREGGGGGGGAIICTNIPPPITKVCHFKKIYVCPPNLSLLYVCPTQSVIASYGPELWLWPWNFCSENCLIEVGMCFNYFQNHRGVQEMFVNLLTC